MKNMMRLILILGWLAGSLAARTAGAQTGVVKGVAADKNMAADAELVAGSNNVAQPNAVANQDEVAVPGDLPAPPAASNAIAGVPPPPAASNAVADVPPPPPPAASTNAVASVPPPAASTNAVAAVPPPEKTVPPVTGNAGSNGSPAGIDLLPGDAADVPEGPPPKNGGANKISLTLDAVPVTDVVNLFSKISGANIIIAGNVSNVFVTANLKDVEWKAALGLALGSVNLSLIEDPSGILMVVTSEMYREKLQQIENTKPLVTKTFTIRYLNAVDFIEQVKQMKLLSPRGTIIASQSKDQERLSLKSSPLPTEIIQNPGITTEIILTDIKEYVDKIANLILLLDKREPQVFIEARIVDVVSDDSKKLGFDWEMLDRFGATLKMQDLKWTFSDEHSLINSTINRDDQADNRRNVDTLNKNYDINNIPYQTVTYEEQPPDSGNYVQVVTPTRTIADTIDRKHDISSVKTDTLTDTRKETKAGTALLSVSDASLFFSALQRLQNSEMISHPLIVVGNKVEAKIHVGERYPTIFSTKQAANPQTGQTESFSERVEWNDLGLTLWVIPEIDRQVDVVRLTVNPQMSTHVKDITTPAGSVYPVISTRQVSTRVNVPSKHTVVIGGLIDNQKGVKEKRVPILSDIPLLGLLFRHTEDTISKHNLLIMLTPTILDERAPLTGLEAVAQQSVDRLEKHPLTPKGNPSPKSGSVKTVTTPAAGLTGDQPTTPSTSSSLPGTTPPPAGLPAPGPGSETPAPPAGANPPSKAGPAQAPAPAN